MELFGEALALEPEHAETHYWLGRAQEGVGDAEAARRAYSDARDLDRNPFRAHSAFNARLREIAGELDGVELCDAVEAFQEATDGPAPGYDLFLDYVHPTKRGNLVLARAAFDAIVSAGWLGAPAADVGFQPDLPGSAPAYDEARDVRMHVALLALFGAMHQYEAMAQLATRLHQAGVEDLPMVRQILAVFPRYLRLEARRLRGEPVSDLEWSRAQQAVEAFYQRELQSTAAGS